MKMSEKVRDNVVVPLVVALVTGVFGLWGGGQITKTRINNQVNFIINQDGVQNGEESDFDDLVEAFYILQDKNEENETEINSLTELKNAAEKEAKNKDLELIDAREALKETQEENDQLKAKNPRK